MGHIVNATSTRIGWSTIWIDQWYSEKLYYHEYLYSMFKIRFFLIYIFTRKHFDKKAIFYSHFEILKIYKTWVVEVYYYSGKLESDYEDYKFFFFLKLYYLEENRDPETRKPKFLYTPLKALVIWNWLYFFGLKNYDDLDIYGFSSILRKFNLKKLKNYLEFLKEKGYIIHKDFYFYFVMIFAIYTLAKKHVSGMSPWKNPKRNTMLRRFYMIAGCYQEMHSYIYIFASILGYTFEKLTKFFKVTVEFFLTNNNCVNAKFLSRFIARKLRQNYPVKRLLNPIRRELLFVMRMSATPIRSYFSKVDKKYLVSEKNIIFKRSIFKVLLMNLFIFFQKYLLLYLKKYKTLFTLDLISMFYWLNKSTINKKDLIMLTKQYINKKAAFICFFEYKLMYDNNKINLFIPKMLHTFFFTKRSKYLNFFSNIFDYLYVHKISLLNNFFFDIILTKNTKALKYSCINLNRYLKFNYWFFNYILDDSKPFKLNNLKSRIKIHTRANNLRGYKMYLAGRFTRKQRAAHYWFSRGKVPLNSITSFVDFAFFTIPLKNSSITVKVWLYKSHDILNLFYVKIF